MFLVLSAGAALGMEKPTIQAPQPGASLGPNFIISGTMPYKAFLVVLTDCVRTDTGELLGSVPGIRHYTNDNGSFRFRCASPRIAWGDLAAVVKYRVRCFEIRPNGQRGPEATVDCVMTP
jgi:hypothetical protein